MSDEPQTKDELIDSLMVGEAQHFYLGSLRYLAQGLAFLSLGLGLFVLVGWYIHDPDIIQVHPTFVPMQYNTALGFALSGAALLALCWSWLRASKILGILILAIGGLTLIEYISGFNLYIDQLFMEHYIQIKTSQPGRMAPNTALCFSLTGAATLIAAASIARPGSFTRTGVLGAVIFGLGFVAFTGYFISIETAYGWGHMTRMAVHTAFGFLILGSGFFTLSWVHEKNLIEGMPGWFPIPLGIGLLTITLTLWQALSAFENAVIAKLGPEAGNYIDEGALVFGLLVSAALPLITWLALKSRKNLRISANACLMYEKALEERKVAEKQVKQMALFAEMNPGPTLRCDRQGAILLANPAAKNIFRLESGTSPMFTSIFKDIPTDLLAECIDNDLSLNRFTKVNSRWYQFTIIGSSEMGMAQTYGMDVTDRKNAEQARQALSRARDYFAAITSHELNTPLTNLQLVKMILGKLHGAPSEADELSTAKNVLETAYSNLEKVVSATSMINDLNMEKISADNKHTGLRLALMSCFDVLRNQSEQRNISFDTDIDEIDDDIIVQGDTFYLQKALIEVISNAIKFSPDGKSVEVTGKVENNIAVIRIANEGIGISEMELERITQPFYSPADVDKHHSSQYQFQGGGIGLGLTIAKLVTEAYGGGLEISSPGEDKGATVIFRLPLSEN